MIGLVRGPSKDGRWFLRPMDNLLAVGSWMWVPTTNRDPDWERDEVFSDKNGGHEWHKNPVVVPGVGGGEASV